MEDRLAEALGDLRVAVHTALWRNLGGAQPDPLWIAEAVRNEQDEAVAFAIVRDRLASQRQETGYDRSANADITPADNRFLEIIVTSRLGNFLRRTFGF